MSEVRYTIGLLLSNAADRRLLTEFLEASGHAVVEGPLAEDDLNHWHDASLVIADEMAARRYGRLLLSLKWTLGPTFIPLLIALPSATDSAPWLRAGFDDVLRLPVTRTELLARLSVFFRLREKSEQQYRAFFENALIGIYRMTPDGRFVMANPALVRMLDHRSFEEMVSAYRDGDDSYLHTIFQHCVESGDMAVGLESSWTKADGETVFFREHVTCVREEEGEVVCFEGTVEDITERKQYEQALQEAKNAAESANRAKTTFLANMSHEIRTPLTGIIGFTSFLARQVDEPQRRYINLIERSGKRLMETLEAVLTLAKLEADRVEMDFDVVNLADEAEEVVQIFRQQANQKGLQLQMQLRRGPHPPLARIDRGALSSITQNLVSNAIKFTSQGSVDVTVRSDDRDVHLDVRDTGIGFDPEFADDLFEPFRQESTGLARSHEGIGLGLSIARQLVEKMDGRITAKSERGEGSTFTITFPRAPQEEPESAEEGRRSVSSIPVGEEARQLHVLLVEDNEDTRALIETLLEGMCQLSLAANAAEAIAMARERDHDLVLMDINLGAGPNGQAILQRLRAMPAYANVPIIALTAYALPGDREAFLRSGFSDYLSKPFTAEELLGLIAGLA